VQPANPPTEPGNRPEAELPEKAVGRGVNGKQLALNFAVGVASSLFAASAFEDMTAGSRRAPATSSANQNAQYNSYNSTYPSGSTLTPQSGQTQYEYGQHPNQQRAVDHGRRADFFGEPPFESRSIYDVADGVVTTAGPSESKARSISDNNR
jgi:hypothetical protein